MTAQNSISNTNFGKYFLYKLGKQKYTSMAIWFLALLGYPFVGICSMMYANVRAKYPNISFESANYNDIYNRIDGAEQLLSFAEVFCVITMVMVVAFGLIVLTSNFRWLYDKKYVDMDIMIPVSTDTRISADFLSGLVVCLTPHVICAIAGNIMIDAAKSKIIGAGVSLDYRYTFTVNSELIIIGLIASVMLFCTGIFVLSVCARKFEAKILPFVYNFIMAIYCLSLEVLEPVFYGSSGMIFGRHQVAYGSFFKAISPFSMMVAYQGRSVNDELAGEFFDFSTITLIILINCIYVILGWYIIKRRGNQCVGQPYIHSVIKHVVLSLLTFAFVAGFAGASFQTDMYGDGYVAARGTTIFFCVLFSFAVFIIIDIKSEQRARRILSTIVRYIITVAVCVGLVALIVFCRSFGKEDYIPETEEIESAMVGVHMGNVFSNDYVFSEYGDVLNFDKLRQIHGEVLELHKNNQKGEGRITIEYKLKNGETVSRDYLEIPKDYIPKAIELAIQSGIHELIDYGANAGIYDAADCIGHNIKIDLTSVEGEHINVFTGEKTYCNVPESNELYGYVRTDIPGDEFYQALKKDYESIDFNKFYCTPYRLVSNIKIEYVLKNGVIDFAGEKMYPFYNYPVYSFCENALALLDKYQKEHEDIIIDTYAIADSITIEKLEGACKTFMSADIMNYMVYEGYEISEIGVYPHDENGTIKSIDGFAEEINELIGYCAPRVYAEGYEGQDLYIVSFTKKLDKYEEKYDLLVRPEYNDRVAEIFEKIKGK